MGPMVGSIPAYIMGSVFLGDVMCTIVGSVPAYIIGSACVWVLEVKSILAFILESVFTAVNGPLWVFSYPYGTEVFLPLWGSALVIASTRVRVELTPILALGSRFSLTLTVGAKEW